MVGMKTYKMIILGDTEVGKTSLLHYFAEGKFHTFPATLGIDFKLKTIEINGKSIRLQIWDTAGQERFETINAAYYRGAHGVIFTYSITNRATCDDGGKNHNQPVPQEIIEFPCLKLNAKTLEIEAIFHQYVRPIEHSKLTEFCTELTGISQEMVENQPTLTETLSKFQDWLIAENLIKAESHEPLKRFAFVTCGDWDLKTMLPGECKYFGISPAWYFQHWINVKRPFQMATEKKSKGMMGMLRSLNIEHQGRHHSGIDDCRNIAEIVKALLKKGTVLAEI